MRSTGLMDITFCYSNCINGDCPRHKSQVTRDYGDWPPVSWADLSVGCPDYIKSLTDGDDYVTIQSEQRVERLGSSTEK